MIHASHAAGTDCYGMPAEYWRINPGMVDQYVAVGPANPVDYNNLISNPPTDYSYPTEDELKAAFKAAKGNQVWKDAIRDYPTVPFGTPFEDIFGSYSYADENMTIMQALWRDDLQLYCQSACAWLNANESPSGYPYTPGDVITHFNTTGMQDPAGLTAALTAMNNASLTLA